MDMTLMLCLASIVCAGAGGYVSVQKRRAVWEGIIFGGVFGPFGLIVAAVLPEDGKTADARQHEAWVRESD